jgi:hypothetical protein
MQILESALAFAITMLVLSLTCSAFVELVHRFGMMREAGLKYMLGQMFDQVLEKFVKPGIQQLVQADSSVPAALHDDKVKELIESARTGFIERMSANRAPMGVTPNATPTDRAADVKNNPKWTFGVLGGRNLTSMTSTEFMERLGSIDIGKTIKEANDKARDAGAAAADAADAVLKDIAQKFEAFGKEAQSYFEGRARLLSVGVAIVLAFAIRVDAIELFNTYLRDPNARNKVIEQTQAATAQYKAVKDAADALKNAPGAAQNDDVKKQVEALQKDLQSLVTSTRSTVNQYADLGLPIGWSKDNVTLNPWVPACVKSDGSQRLVKESEACKLNEGEKLGPREPTCVKQNTGRLIKESDNCTDGEKRGPLTPTCVKSDGSQRLVMESDACKINEGEKLDEVGSNAIKLAASLFLGGILIGLGAPFWYDAVTGLTNIRSVARNVLGSGEKQRAVEQEPAVAAAQGLAVQPAPTPAIPDPPQPKNPVGAFKISAAGSAAK